MDDFYAANSAFKSIFCIVCFNSVNKFYNNNNLKVIQNFLNEIKFA